jgi:transposase
MTEHEAGVIVGVDTHADAHVAVVVDHLGRVLDTFEVPTTMNGYRQLLGWARRHGRLDAAGVEGTGAYGAGLARFLEGEGVVVVEVNRPNRQHRRRRGKSDPTDAEAAARAVLSGEASVVPKARAGIVESVRAIHMVRRSAMKARTQAGNQIKDLVLTAPESIRRELRDRTTRQRALRAARWRPAPTPDPEATTRRALRTLARRWLALSEEIRNHDRELAKLLQLAAPNLLAEPGVGPDVAAKLLIAAGDNPGRLRSEACFAALCGVSPVQASSGKTQRHRLNRGGNRQANNALWTVAFVRWHRHPETAAYVARRSTEGLNRPEIMRCLKRHLARRFHHLLLADLHHASHLHLTALT